MSDDVRTWNDPRTVAVPHRDWEIVQVGNCGSPIEIPEGRLVLTHGVGPMRRYAMGAVLLDLEQPHLVLATLREPLLVPDDDDERTGTCPTSSTRAVAWFTATPW